MPLEDLVHKEVLLQEPPHGVPLPLLAEHTALNYDLVRQLAGALGLHLVVWFMAGRVLPGVQQ